MKLPREGFAAVCMKKRIYAVGGFAGKASGYQRSMERYNPKKNSWKKMPEMHVRRSGHAGVGINGRIYVFGGFDGDNDLSSMEIYNVKEASWSKGGARLTDTPL